MRTFFFYAQSPLDHALQYPRQFLEEKALFGWDCKDENVSLS